MPRGPSRSSQAQLCISRPSQEPEVQAALPWEAPSPGNGPPRSTASSLCPNKILDIQRDHFKENKCENTQVFRERLLPQRRLGSQACRGGPQRVRAHAHGSRWPRVLLGGLLSQTMASPPAGPGRARGPCAGVTVAVLRPALSRHRSAPHMRPQNPVGLVF